MKVHIMRYALAAAATTLLLATTPGMADDKAAAEKADTNAKYAEAFKKFSETPPIASMIAESYGWALFPTIGKGGFFVGGAFGKGRVYAGGIHVGNSSMAQATIGFQLGGTAFSQLVLFKNRDAFEEFTSGKFTFGAEASAVAINAGAQARANTAGTSTSASDPAPGGAAQGSWTGGMATFVFAKGGLMYEASIGGQAFDYEPLVADKGPG
ncbi:MAG: YSC84-related protein [Gammaproteobacteria bacterium]